MPALSKAKRPALGAGLVLESGATQAFPPHRRQVRRVPGRERPRIIGTASRDKLDQLIKQANRAQTKNGGSTC